MPICRFDQELIGKSDKHNHLKTHPFLDTTKMSDEEINECFKEVRVRVYDGSGKNLLGDGELIG